MSRFKCDKTNMSIVESNDSNNQMVRHENKVIKIDTWDQYDDKTVAELLTSTQVYFCALILIILSFHN